jgi:two-component system, OmpR family, alkaline phosphatase synthesis response regulator PhoP
MLIQSKIYAILILKGYNEYEVIGLQKKIIAVVDDEKHICELLQYNLEQNGYQVKTFDSSEKLFDFLSMKTPDLFLLDIMLPGMDGLDLCKALRSREETKNTPIVMLTAKAEELDRILGLEIGADDYITKPFSVRELSARIKALFRRTNYEVIAQEAEKIIHEKDIRVHLDERQAYKNLAPLQLTLKEFELLHILMLHKGNVLTRDVLLDKVWGYDYVGETRTVDVHIRNLRKSIGDENENYIETVRGIGYRFRK